MIDRRIIIKTILGALLIGPLKLKPFRNYEYELVTITSDEIEKMWTINAITNKRKYKPVYSYKTNSNVYVMSLFTDINEQDFVNSIYEYGLKLEKLVEIRVLNSSLRGFIGFEPNFANS